MAAITPSKKADLQDWKTTIPQLPKYGMTISFLGVRASGKTYLLHDVVDTLRKTRKYTACFLFSATAKTQHDAYTFCPKSHKYDDLQPLARLLELQEKMCDLNREKQKNKAAAHEFVDSRVLIILDDFVNFGVRNSPIITALYTHGRHLRHKENCFVDICTLGQDITQLSTVQRSNCDLIFTARTLSYRSTKMTAEDYLSVSTDRKAGYALLDSLGAEEFLFLMVWVTKQPKRQLADYCFYAKATGNKPFKIGSKQQWKHDEEK